MVRNLWISLVLIVILFIPSPVRAEKIAGTSARLEHIPSGSDDTRSLVLERSKKRAAIRSVLQKYRSPLLAETDAFLNACETYEIDCYLLPSIAGLESSFGKALLPGSHNPFGWGGGHIRFDSWSDGFHAVAKGLRTRYMDRGAETIEQIGPIYAASPTWAQRVRIFHQEFLDAEAALTFDSHELALTQ